jgi:hypothetical protein
VIEKLFGIFDPELNVCSRVEGRLTSRRQRFSHDPPHLRVVDHPASGTRQLFA